MRQLKIDTRQAINVKTVAESNAVLKIFADKGYVWLGGDHPINSDFKYPFEMYSDKTCISNNNYFGYANIDYYESVGVEIISFNDFLLQEGKLPEKWCIKINANQNEVGKWFNENSQTIMHLNEL